MQRHFARQAPPHNKPNAPHPARRNLERISALVPKSPGWAEVPFSSLKLSSHFQPILSVAQRKVIGYEGLLLAHNESGQTLRPETLFGMTGDVAENLYLDLLARALHIRNFPAMGASGLLFLNVLPEAAEDDPRIEHAFRNLIAHFDTQPRNIVVEILETGVADEDRLREAVYLYKQLGCLVALDDFGVGHSNFERLCNLQPDIVKIDRSVMQAAAKHRDDQRALNNVVRMIHECGAAAVIEGIEERRDALIALETDADYLQGYFFARPGRDALNDAAVDGIFGSLLHLYESDADLKQVGAAADVREYAWLLENMAAAVERGAGFTLAAEALLDNAKAVRAYLLGADGTWRNHASSSKSINAAQAQEPSRPNGRGWQTRHLIDTAIKQPTQVHFSRPNLPTEDPDRGVARGVTRGVTLSRAFDLNGEQMVLCADLLLTGNGSGELAAV